MNRRHIVLAFLAVIAITTGIVAWKLREPAPRSKADLMARLAGGSNPAARRKIAEFGTVAAFADLLEDLDQLNEDAIDIWGELGFGNVKSYRSYRALYERPVGLGYTGIEILSGLDWQAPNEKIDTIEAAFSRQHQRVGLPTYLPVVFKTLPLDARPKLIPYLREGLAGGKLRRAWSLLCIARLGPEAKSLAEEIISRLERSQKASNLDHMAARTLAEMGTAIRPHVFRLMRALIRIGADERIVLTTICGADLLADSAVMYERDATLHDVLVNAIAWKLRDAKWNLRICSDLESHSPKARHLLAAAITQSNVLRSIVISTDTISVLIEGFSHPHSKYRAAAIFGVGRNAMVLEYESRKLSEELRDRVIKALSERLTDDDASVRAVSAFTLMRFGVRTARIAGVLRDNLAAYPIYSDLEYALELLVEFDPDSPETVTALIDLVKDRSDFGALQALSATSIEAERFFKLLGEWPENDLPELDELVDLVTNFDQRPKLTTDYLIELGKNENNLDAYGGEYALGCITGAFKSFGRPGIEALGSWLGRDISSIEKAEDLALLEGVEEIKALDDDFEIVSPESLQRVTGPLIKQLEDTIDLDYDDDWEQEKREALFTLGILGSEAGAATRKKLRSYILNEEHTFELRWVATLSLIDVQGPDARCLPVLTQALSQRTIEGRWQAAQALGWIGPQAASALPALEKAVDDPQHRLRACAREAIAKIRS